MNVSEYIDRLNTRYRTGISTEHSYRGDLQNLLEDLAPDVMVTNEPSRVACGAPDYIITKKNIPIGYIEAKDIGKPLDSNEYKEQFDRYRNSLSNLIITDYLDFRLFRDGNFVTSVTIGDIAGNKIVPKPEATDQFTDLLKEFYTHVGQTIKSASQLSKMMAGKARLLANVVEKALSIDEEGNLLNEPQNLDIYTQYKAFQAYLIHDIKPSEFADVYAQTIAYGMFAARLNDPSLTDFSRIEAAELIPKSNPFLRNLFQQIAGYNFDIRIKWIIDALADIFRATNVAELLKDFGKSTQQHDPMIHFYETFLAEYDPKLRKSRGVYYTPEPVVNFIVKAVDDILKSEFNLPQGLADTSKIKIKVPKQGKMVEQEVHKVQILDPAAGTGTFLAEVIKQVYSKFEGQQGVWSNYVEEHIIPRLNGFEILMAPYTMAHLKLDMLLKETGYKPKREQRLKVFLTNSLEEHHPDTGTLFAGWLSNEANEANHIKKDTPVMVVLGNPPYSVSSANKGEWIQNLIADYKKGLNEKKLNLDDDYIKFIRYGQYLIDKNREGLLAFISNNSFIDGITHRQMRKHLLDTFNNIYILDLHGNAKKIEKTLDGNKDENVFDIMQGVSINIFIKTLKNINKTPSVKHFNYFGNREDKYGFLSRNSLNMIKWQELDFFQPNYFFVPKDFRLQNEYSKGFSVAELFNIYGWGIKTERDSISIHFDIKTLQQTVNDFKNLDENEIRNKYKLGKDSRDWGINRAKVDINTNYDFELLVHHYAFRPFDNRITYYTGTSKGFQGTPSYNTMKHVRHNNYGLLMCRQSITSHLGYFITNKICDVNFTGPAGQFGAGQVFPLYLYSDVSEQQSIEQVHGRIPNLTIDTLKYISVKLELKFTNEKVTIDDSYAPIDILDYIYAVLHSPTYREKYKEFLKIDFPRIPYPKDKKTFWKLVKLGGELRQIHLLESPVIDKFITTYPVTGPNEVGKVRYENKKVWINDVQYFDRVPQVAWEFYIGGYQPAQKWLKDRKGRTLSFEDIQHYQKIIVALKETDRLMKEIDKIDFLGE